MKEKPKVKKLIKSSTTIGSKIKVAANQGPIKLKIKPVVPTPTNNTSLSRVKKSVPTIKMKDTRTPSNLAKNREQLSTNRSVLSLASNKNVKKRDSSNNDRKSQLRTSPTSGAAKGLPTNFTESLQKNLEQHRNKVEESQRSLE